LGKGLKITWKYKTRSGIKMQTELAQIISLTSYGNEFIRTGQIPENYFPINTVFQHCNSVDFWEFKKSFLSSKQTERMVAKNPIEWFKLLKKEGCVNLRLYYIPAKKNEFGPEYNLAGFVGGAGTWLIETNFGKYSHYWQKRWQGTQKDAPDGKIWGVNYARVVKKLPPANQQMNVEGTKLLLEGTLNELVNFCFEQDLGHWRDTFQKAQKILSDPAPNVLYYHQDLIVIKNYSLDAQQLLFGASEAWVFGGMGWWNDMGFNEKDIQEKYLLLSQQLYERILESIIATSNSL
jgi:hypothetical protein